MNTIADSNERTSNSDLLKSAAGQAGERAQQFAGQAKGLVSQQIDQRSTDLGNQLSTHVDSLRTVSDSLRQQGQETPAKLADNVAQRVDGVAQYLRNADGDQLLTDLENIGRRQPWVVLTAGLALGFAASRLLKASSAQRYHSYSERNRTEPSYDAAYDTSYEADYAGSASQRSMNYYED